MLTEYHYQTNKSFEDTIDALKVLLMERGFGTLCTIPLSEKFNEKNLSFDGKLSILEICNPFEANQILEVNAQALYLLPCKIIVREINNVTTIHMASPTSLASLLNDPQLIEAVQKIESTLLDAIESV